MTNQEILDKCHRNKNGKGMYNYLIEIMDAAREDEAVAVLQSLHSDLSGFKEMEPLTPDIKTGLGIAIEQIERYMRGDIVKHKNEKL